MFLKVSVGRASTLWDEKEISHLTWETLREKTGTLLEHSPVEIVWKGFETPGEKFKLCAH